MPVWVKVILRPRKTEDRAGLPTRAGRGNQSWWDGGDTLNDIFEREAICAIEMPFHLLDIHQGYKLKLSSKMVGVSTSNLSFS